MFVAILTYTRPLKEVDALMHEHMRFLDQHYDEGLFIVSGRQIPRTGGVILVRSGEREHVQSVLENDPFVLGGVATFQLIEFKPSQMQKGFETFAQARR